MDRDPRRWDVFDSWVTHPPTTAGHLRDWAVFDPWLAAAESRARPLREEVIALRQDWANRVGTEVDDRDWTTFRPLRLDREEDWSDWLDHLIATNDSFAARLLKNPSELWEGTGDQFWRAWAMAFCGTVEQKILGIPSTAGLLAKVSHFDLYI